MSRLTRALDQLALRHRPRGAAAVLAGARHDAAEHRSQRRTLLAGGLAAAVLLLAGLAAWAGSGPDTTQVRTEPGPAPTPETSTRPPDTSPAPTTTTTADGPTTTTTAPPEQPTGDTPVVVHFSPSDGSGACAAVTEVERTVSGSGVLQAALEAQLAGPTEAERDAGLSSWFSSETAGMLTSVAISNGTARVDFDAALASTIPNASTSCGSASLLAQLDRTARQFPTVGRVIYSFDGDVEAFYGWLQGIAPEVAPQWDGTLEEDWPSGALRAPGFDEHVQREQPSWAFDPREAAMVLVGLPSLTEPVDVDIAHGAIDGGRTVVTITQSGFRDDSVNATQHRLVFEQDRDGALVRFVEGSIATRCQPGRGHQDFQTELCA
jgi:hypothetical protein